jgi:hypothetical protein
VFKNRARLVTARARFLESVAMKYYYRETAAAVAPVRRRRGANHTRIPRADDTYPRVHTHFVYPVERIKPIY